MPLNSAFADPSELERKAAQCRVQAARIEELARNLEARSRWVFVNFKGTAADSLDTAIRQQLASMYSIQESIRSAALALESGASQVRDAIRRAEETERRQR